MPSDVIAPKNLDKNVAKEVTRIAYTILADTVLSN